MEEKTYYRPQLMRITRVVAILFAAFFLYTAFTRPFISIIQRSVNVCGGIAIFSLYDLAKTKQKKWVQAIDVVMIIVMVICLSYYVKEGKMILMPTFSMSEPLMYLGIALVLCVMESARRCIGKAVPIISLVALLYAFFGNLIPGSFGHRGFKVSTIIEILCYTDRGIFGSVTNIAATTIATFIIFGAILFATGGGKTFIDLACLITGNAYGGAAKLATIASGLFGMISGSAGANVATTGTFTIPLMKRLGYSSEFAGAVEASASSGGQIMPPIMGAAAFIMADLLGMSYSSIALAAIIPAFLFYYGVFLSIDCHSKRFGLRGIPADEMPTVKEVLHYSRSLPIFVPIAVLLIFFMSGFTATKCASYAIAVAVVLYIGTDIKNFKERLKNLINGLEDATKDMITVITLIACSQILLSVISTTGVGVKFTNVIVAIGGNNIILAGICAMVATMIIGMGMPTVAAYILAASVIAPALTQIGVDMLAAHFFVFYYAIFAGLTPPICGTIFIASSLAQSHWIKTAIQALKLSVAAFLVPFIIILDPALVLVGTTGGIIRCTITAFIGITALSAGFMRYFMRPVNLVCSILLIFSGVLLVDTGVITDAVGILIVAVVFGYLFFTRKKFPREIREA